MKKSLLTLSIAGMAATGAMAQELETVDQRASYYFGLDLGSNLAQQVGSDRIDVDAVLMGLEDGLAQNEPQLTLEQIQQAVTTLQQELQAEAQAEAEELRAPGEDFLRDNAERDGVVVTDSGLQYEIVEQTDGGASPDADDTVRVHYHGTLIDDTVFDSSVERGEPVEFPLNGVIPGWTEGVQLMTEGDTYRFFIPAELAYRDQSVGEIPPYSTLIFEVELIEVLPSENGNGDGNSGN